MPGYRACEFCGSTRHLKTVQVYPGSWTEPPVPGDVCAHCRAYKQRAMAEQAQAERRADNEVHG